MTTELDHLVEMAENHVRWPSHSEDKFPYRELAALAVAADAWGDYVATDEEVLNALAAVSAKMKEIE